MEDLFNLMSANDEKPIEKMGILEERIAKILKVVREPKEEKRLLEVKVNALEADLLRKKEELDRVRLQMEETDMVHTELNNLTEERGLLRTRIEGILRELESVELN